MLHVIKYMYPNIYDDLLKRLGMDYDFITFCSSDLNIKLLKNIQYTNVLSEDESLANFFAFNPHNMNIPFAFFYQMNFKNSKVELPPNQQKYLDMLLEVAGKIVMSDE